MIMKKTFLLFAGPAFSGTLICMGLLISFSSQAQVTYQKKMVSPVGYFGGLVYSNEHNSNTFFVGNIYGPTKAYPCITMFNSNNGVVNTSQCISGPNSSIIVSSVSKQGDNLYLTASILDSNKAKGGVIKYNLSSNTLVWQKIMDLDSVSFSIKSIAGDNKNYLYLLGSYENTLNGNNDLFVSKIDTNGVLIWTKAFGEASWDESASNIIYNGDREIYVTGIGFVGIMGRSTITRLDDEGNILNASAIITKYSNPRFSENYSGIVNGKMYTVDQTIISDSPGPILIRVMDTTLNTTSTCIIDGLLVGQLYCNDSNLLLTGSADTYGGYNGFRTVRLDGNLNVVGSRYFNKINTWSLASTASCFINSSNESFHFFYPGDDTVFVVRANSQEIVSCMDTVFSPNPVTLLYADTPYEFINDTLSVSLTNVSVEVTSMIVESISLCDPTADIGEYNSGDNVIVYPNPATDKIFINITERQDLKIQIFNVAGECVMQRELIDIANEIDISFLMTGIYLIRVTLADRIFQRKLVKV
jgi:hypothetical protein